jgi:predicted RNA-binding Zn ribbon-like protein
MVFAHDTEAALTAATALVNTAGSNRDDLPDLAALDEFFHAYAWTGRREHTETELQAVRELRPRLRQVWYEDEDGVVAVVNGLLHEYHALPQLVKHDNWPYHVHATPADAPLATRMAVEAAMAFADVVRAGELDRLRRCDQPDCDNVMVDLSRNRSKRFCGVVCGNRAAVTAYRARKAAATRPPRRRSPAAPRRP